MQSSSAFGQSYVAPPQPQTFGTQTNSYGAVPAPNNLQTFNQFNNQPFTQNASNPMPIGNPMGQSSVLNPTQLSTFSPGLPPIEVAQQAIQQQPILRNPTPPPGWNDPPALKSRVVS